MKAIALCGSPRKDGNTEYLLNRCLSRLKESDIDTELITLRGKKLPGCIGCGRCREIKDGTCAVKNDDFASILEDMKSADIILTGSPVYFGSATPELMAVLDRAGYVGRSNGHFFTRKIGGPIVVARRAGQNFTFAQLLYWYMINNMIVPGSRYWNIAFGGAVGAVKNDEEALATIDNFSDNIAWLAKKIQE